MRVKYLLSVALVAVIGLGLGGCAWLVAPRITAVLTANPTSGEAELSVTFTLSESTGPITSYTLSFGDGTTPATGTDVDTTIVHTYEEAGSYTAQLTVQDDRGRTDTDTVTITVTDPDVPPGPTATLGVDDANPTVDQELTFYVEGTAPAGKKIVGWSLDFDDGTVIEKTPEVTTLDTDENHTYTDTGTYTAVLTVEDEDGATASDSVTVTVTDPPPNITLFTVDDQTPSVGQTVSFTLKAESGSAERKLVKWQINFGDGGSVTQDGFSEDELSVDYSHSYTQTGSYTAEGKVWDDVDATDSETEEIEVN